MTKIDIFSGFLGAGKTTLIKKLIAEAYAGEKLVLIENEFGEINIDGGFLKESGIEISEMSAGCICCSLVGDFNKALREVVERRVRFVLRRLSALVPRVDVKLVDVNGPRGGIDKRCQIELRTDGAGPVVVSSVAKDWRTALDGALARAVRLVLRVWRRATVARRPRQHGFELES